MTSSLRHQVTSEDHVLGPAGAPVTLIEYGDYECPFSGTAFAAVERLQGHFDGRLRFVYRHFPLVDVHPRAVPAALLAEAAADEGAFWGMHALLSTHQDALDDVYLVRYAERFGLRGAGPIGEAAEAHLARVERDLHSGQDWGVTGTPTFFVNGARHGGGHDFAALGAAVEAAEAAGRASASDPASHG